MMPRICQPRLLTNFDFIAASRLISLSLTMPLTVRRGRLELRFDQSDERRLWRCERQHGRENHGERNKAHIAGHDGGSPRERGLR